MDRSGSSAVSTPESGWNHELIREQWIAAGRHEVFEFFSDPRNLERITPSWLGFQILDRMLPTLGSGVRIHYRIQLLGIPMRWVTRISAWKLDEGFVDVQERGPYAFWEHSHRFEARGQGVLMIDRVRYRLPFGSIGRIVHALWVRAALGRIFDYRFSKICEFFPRGG